VTEALRAEPLVDRCGRKPFGENKAAATSLITDHRVLITNLITNSHSPLPPLHPRRHLELQRVEADEAGGVVLVVGLGLVRLH
jgi:hypothetical protein